MIFTMTFGLREARAEFFSRNKGLTTCEQRNQKLDLEKEESLLSITRSIAKP